MKKQAAIEIAQTTAAQVRQALLDKSDDIEDVIAAEGIMMFEPEKLFDFVVQYKYTSPEIILRQLATWGKVDFQPMWLESTSSCTALTVFAQVSMTLSNLISEVEDDDSAPAQVTGREPFEKINVDDDDNLNTRIGQPDTTEAANDKSDDEDAGDETDQDGGQVDATTPSSQDAAETDTKTEETETGSSEGTPEPDAQGAGPGSVGSTDSDGEKENAGQANKASTDQKSKKPVKKTTTSKAQNPTK